MSNIQNIITKVNADFMKYFESDRIIMDKNTFLNYIDKLPRLRAKYPDNSEDRKYLLLLNEIDADYKSITIGKANPSVVLQKILFLIQSYGQSDILMFYKGNCELVLKEFKKSLESYTSAKSLTKSQKLKDRLEHNFSVISKIIT